MNYATPANLDFSLLELFGDVNKAGFEPAHDVRGSALMVTLPSVWTCLPYVERQKLRFKFLALPLQGECRLVQGSSPELAKSAVASTCRFVISWKAVACRPGHSSLVKGSPESQQHRNAHRLLYVAQAKITINTCFFHHVQLTAMSTTSTS